MKVRSRDGALHRAVDAQRAAAMAREEDNAVDGHAFEFEELQQVAWLREARPGYQSPVLNRCETVIRAKGPGTRF
jgi:hypothetical protein